ncbi:hypothetical protein S40293_04599 [Stachybotrys chartarum IBT 40293]|nr:hypothetical protein S40293_04599 [Stachybotrys chartarum IBT 40293]
MLAAHRDQENMVHGHHAQSKQQPKTPGARYPKTPSKLLRNDENAPTGLIGKSGIKNGVKFGENNMLQTKGKGAQQGLVTPLDNRSRAPLGNKTTNAKARTVQKSGVKDIVNEFEKTVQKPTTAQRPKQRGPEIAPLKFAVMPDDKEAFGKDDEPEYAPPNPEPLPYQSDVLPEGGLTTRGLKRENLFKGYYHHFCNPVDENGVSRRDKEFDEEMKLIMKKAEEHNERELAGLNWNILDLTETAEPPGKALLAPKQPAAIPSTTIKKNRERNPPTIASRRAASALALRPGTGNGAHAIFVPAIAPARKPLTSFMRSTKSALQNSQPKASLSTNTTGQVVSRTTLGYNKGKHASSMVHPQARLKTVQPRQRPKQSAFVDGAADLTVTPARVQQARANQAAAENNPSPMAAPAFASMFELEDDDEDLLPLGPPQLSLDDEDEEFELKLDL